MGPTLKTIEYREDHGRYRMKVQGGLHFIRGNKAPYFSLTHSTDRVNSRGRWEDDSGGAGHDTILKYFPEYADLAALHLSDIDGVPMHALENGFYWLGGSVVGKWYESDRKTPNFEHVARHFRITEAEARALADDFGPHYSPTAGFLAPGPCAAAKAKLALWVDAQRPRWKAEADACIAKHGLVVYGNEAHLWKAPARVASSVGGVVKWDSP